MTARYVGMGGAMEALGADISTIRSNPAGIGMFRHSTANVSFGVITQQDAPSIDNWNKTHMSFDQAGFVYSMRTGRSSFLNVAFNYTKERDFNLITNPSGSTNGGSNYRMGALRPNQFGVGDDGVDVFESSPIPVSVELSLKADYVCADSLKTVCSRLEAMPQVEELVYKRSLVDKLNSNLSKVSMVMAVFIALLLFISYVLINNTVRLSIYARRFTIHTMSMVGATRAFIRRPFLVQALFQGICAALLATLMLVALLFVVRGEFPQLFAIFDLNMLLLTFGIVLAAGALICVSSTFLVVNRLVSLRKAELYY